jgi:multidrug efflux pump subunit AcrA (membrane-fusion protein)
MLWFVIRPAYVHPSNRTYTSGMGYPAVLRKLGKPFPVTTAHVVARPLRRHFLGEGLMESEPVRVPIVPEGRVVRVHVNEGDYVKRGQLLAELDPRRQQIKIDRAKAAIDVATLQVERARVGSVYSMEMERPEIVAARLKFAKEQVAVTKQLVDAYAKLRIKKVISNDAFLNYQLEADRALASLQEAEENIKISQAGRPLSIKAAELALQDAQWQHQLLSQELEEFKIYAVADGMVAQVLIHEGEYNRNPGTSAFVLAVGKWFGVNFDQTNIGRFKEGETVEVRLEAFPGKVFKGHVQTIKPMVTYNPGGPEAARPIRPLGTGSPEWPATFTTCVALVGGEEELRDVVPGLTGFAEVNVKRRGLVVPDGSVTSVSAGRGIAYVVEGDRFRVQPVAIGQVSDGWMEIESGLKPGMEVIADGHQILRMGDRIVTSPAKLPEPRHLEEAEELAHPAAPPPRERHKPQDADQPPSKSETLVRTGM